MLKGERASKIVKRGGLGKVTRFKSSTCAIPNTSGLGSRCCENWVQDTRESANVRGSASFRLLAEV